MNSKYSVIMYIGQGNITSILLPLIKVIKNRKLNQFSILQQLYLFCLLTSVSTIYSGLLLLIQFFQKVFCPACNARDFGKNGFYERDEKLPLLPITINWKVQRYYCKICPSETFNSFTNTLFYNKEQYPVFFLVSCLSQLFPLNSSFIRQLTAFVPQNHNNENKDGDEFAIPVIMEQNHLPDDFATSLQYFLDECLDEKLRRLCAGLFAIYFDNISKVGEITTMARKTIRRGKKELLLQLEINTKKHKIRRPGAGRKAKIKKYKHLVLEFVKDYTAGDPMSRKKWMRISLRNVSDELGNILSYVSVGKILNDDGYSLRTNKKTRRTRERHPKQGAQFDFIKAALDRFQTKGIPILAIDGKKTEYIGAFKQPGKVWSTEDQQFQVYDHDYSNLAEGKLIPYGIYDYQKNEGYIVAGIDLETTEFAIDCLVIWWKNRGSKLYPKTSEIALTCDAGKPNSYRGNLFKFLLQTKFVDKFGISVHIMHYTPGDSKYHIIERQLFSPISRQFNGNPLFSYDKAMALIRGTKTNAGLEVRAILHEKDYQRGLTDTFTDLDYKTININPADTNPEFNYTIQPRTELGILFTLIEAEEEQIEKAIKKFGNSGYKSWGKAMEQAKQLSEDNCWKYHEVSDMILKDIVPKRVDGQRGRPGPNTEMYFEFYIQIEYTLSKSVEGNIEYLNKKSE